MKRDSKRAAKMEEGKPQIIQIKEGGKVKPKWIDFYSDSSTPVEFGYSTRTPRHTFHFPGIIDISFVTTHHFSNCIDKWVCFEISPISLILWGFASKAKEIFLGIRIMRD